MLTDLRRQSRRHALVLGEHAGAAAGGRLRAPPAHAAHPRAQAVVAATAQKYEEYVRTSPILYS